MAAGQRLGKDVCVRVLAELDRITEEQDRSATFELIRTLTDHGVGESERERIGYALARLSDPRSVTPLTGIARDRDRPDEVRKAALWALEGSEIFPVETLRDWWDTGDDVVRGCVLRQVTRGEADLVEPILNDPAHPLHRDALVGIGVTFEEPRWQRYQIAALDHSDPAVRRTAAYHLGWDEPVAAESALHRVAVNDSSVEAACAAIDSLRYYASRATLRLLHELARGDDERATEARAAAAGLLSDFEDDRAGIGEWLTPVADLLASPEIGTVTEIDTAPARSGAPRSKPHMPSAAELFGLFSDPDGPWEPKLAVLRRHMLGTSWNAMPEADRPGLAAFLSGHPDPQVRALCCWVVSNWDAVDVLLALAHDPDPNVRQSAIYTLRYMPSSPEIATLTWDLITSGEVAGTRGQEALVTCAAHTPPGELDDRLIDLARSDLRESIRAEAITLLGDNVESLLYLLSEPPLLTWAVHTRLLGACRGAGLRPSAVSDLRDADNRYVARALANLDSR
ncbi:HEAT repeat domain-containing protein [Nocardia sp. NPDC058058]|uniref:HEAT repeat domain-containing protein n=1 Tax=Nocardia sp. NPDC058058 TaxID=3346317 RepID=UPI0036D7CEA5